MESFAARARFDEVLEDQVCGKRDDRKHETAKCADICSFGVDDGTSRGINARCRFVNWRCVELANVPDIESDMFKGSRADKLRRRVVQERKPTHPRPELDVTDALDLDWHCSPSGQQGR